MADEKKNGKTKPGGAKPDAKAARAHTIELTAEDVTPADEGKAAGAGKDAGKDAKPDAGKDKTAAAKPEPKPDNKPEAKPAETVAARGGAGGFLGMAIAGLFGGVLALLGAAVLISFQMIDLSGSAGQRARQGIDKLDKQVGAALAEAEKKAEARETALAALKADAAKAASRASVHEDMLGKTTAAVNEMKAGLKKTTGQVAVMNDRLGRLTGSLAAAEKRLESLNGAIGSLGAKLESEAEARKALGPRIAANAGMLEKRGLDIGRLMKWQDAMSAESRKLGNQMTGLIGGLKDIERSVAEASNAGGGEPSSAGVRLALLDRKIQRLEKDMSGLTATLQSLPAVPPDLSPQIAVLEKTVARFDKNFADSGKRNAAVRNDVRKLDERVRDLGLLAGRLQALDTRIDEVKSRYAELGSSMRLIQSAARVLGLGEDGNSAALTGLEAKIAGLSSDLAAKITALEKATAGIGEAEAKLAGVDVRLESVKAAQTALAAMQQRAARQQAAMKLSRDLLSGAPYSQALAGFVTLAPQAKVPAAVKALAPSGVPSLDTLKTEFTEIRAAIDAAGILKSDDGLMGRLMKSAGSVVSVRRTGPVAGTSPSAVASRIADYLDKGKLASAIQEAGGYGGPASDRVAAWAKKADARLQAEGFAADAMSLAMAVAEQG